MFRGASLLLLPYALAQGSFVLLTIFTIFYGLDWIATVPPTISMTRQIFGMHKSSIIYGWIFASHQAGAAVAAYGGGLIYKFLIPIRGLFSLQGCFVLWLVYSSSLLKSKHPSKHKQIKVEPRYDEVQLFNKESFDIIQTKVYNINKYNKR